MSYHQNANKKKKGILSFDRKLLRKRVINRKEMSLTRQVNNRVIMENKFQRDFRIKREKLD